MEVGLSKDKLINNQGMLLNVIHLVGYDTVDSQIYLRNLTRIELSIYTEVKKKKTFSDQVIAQSKD
jgi:predicted phosphohydrolase